MKCKVCGSKDVRIKIDVYGINRYGNIVGGTHMFRLDAGQGRVWDANQQRYKYASLLDCYSQNLHNTLTSIRNQHGVSMVKKQFGQCYNCGYNMHLDTGRPYNVKP